MKRKRKYNTLFVLLMTVLFLPILFSIVENHTKQHQFTLPLKGDITINTNPYIKVDSWLDGSYQDSLDNYLKNNLGVGKLFIRLHNQLDFSIFRKSNAKDVVIGKDNYLFEKGYIDSYMGTNFIGEEEMTNKVKMIRELQDTLSNYGKKLFIVIAPGKGYLYPDKIPDKYYKEKQEKTNYKCFVDKITENNIDFIDFNKWFFTRKDVPRELLVPQTGIHWSFYSAIEVMDSIAHFIENKYHYDLAEIMIDSIEKSIEPMYSDDDVEKGLNLLFPIKKHAFTYYKYHIDATNKDKPKLLTLSDSFYWILYGNSIINQIFSNQNQFWYYNSEVFSPEFGGPHSINPSTLNCKEEILKHDIIMLMATETSLYKFPWGFTERALKSFKATDYDLRIQKMIQNIEGNKEWFNNIKQTAINENMPLDSALYFNAKYMVDTE
jgi:SGNH hydrolase-like domain, acetyltransferase AlgX